MTRNEKIRKLGSAIRDYRGAYKPSTGKWIRPPEPTALNRVQKWLTELGIDVADGLAKIHGFESFAQMRTWISAL